ncbi:unnamed protein product, partial [Cylicocyclus nassatus]
GGGPLALTRGAPASNQVLPSATTPPPDGACRVLLKHGDNVSDAVMRLLAALCLLLACAIRYALATVKCYCTDDHCVPYGACDGAVCLVGILRENNQVIRTCGSRPLGCHRDEDDRWTDLCACDQPFCNTFSYLRSHTSQRRETHPPDDVPLVFERVDRPDDGFPPEQGPVTVSSLLTVLLVVVPLTVGAATVLVVAFNYYCHLC